MTNFGKLRRTAIAAIVAGLAAGIGGHAWAHGGHHGHDRGAMMDPAKMDERIESMVKRMLSRVDATDEQRAKGVELLSASTVDRAAIEGLRTEQMKLADDASKRVSLAMADAAEVLTPEQRARLAQRLKERQGRWTERQGRWTERRSSPSEQHKPRG